MVMLGFYSVIAIGRVNHCQHILYTPKKILYIKSTKKRINQFEIGYMVNPTLHVNNVFR